MTSSSSLRGGGGGGGGGSDVGYDHHHSTTLPYAVQQLSSPCEESVEIQNLVDKTCAHYAGTTHNECCHLSIPQTCDFLEESCKKDVCDFLLGIDLDADHQDISLKNTIESTTKTILGDTLDAICSNKIILNDLSHEKEAAIAKK